MKLLSSIFGGMGLTVVTSLLTLSACGGDDNTVTTSAGGTASAGGSTSAGGGGAVGGSTAGGTSAESTSCPVKVPDNALMTDFSEIADGTVTPATVPSGVDDISWGNSGATLTGGTFVYYQTDADTPTGTVTGGALHITAAMSAVDYAGFVFYFGPTCGSDGSAYTGFKFDISGTMPGIQLDIQVQMTPNYPLNTNGKGTCDYAAHGYTDLTKWIYCTNPHVAFENVPGIVELSATTAQTVTVPWSLLTGGYPVVALDPTQLLGIQLQFNCGTTASNVDITLDNLTFYK
jgi:hypothetical protein